LITEASENANNVIAPKNNTNTTKNKNPTHKSQNRADLNETFFKEPVVKKDNPNTSYIIDIVNKRNS